MILPDHDIFRQHAGGALGIEPFNKDQIQPASYDLLLGSKFRAYNDTDKRNLDPKSADRRTILLQPATHGCVWLPSLGFMLASTVEKIRMPDHLVGRVEGKSSLARMGLFVHVTAGFIDPGFEGHITLELFNANSVGILLYPKMPIAQISFERLCSPAEKPYGHSGLGSKYVGQCGPVESMYYKNFLKEGND